jgi:hypothetical protein
MIIKGMRNDRTGEMAPAHRLGRDEDGRSLCLFVEGWSPVDEDGQEIDPASLECDADGNYID